LTGTAAVFPPHPPRLLIKEAPFFLKRRGDGRGTEGLLEVRLKGSEAGQGFLRPDEDVPFRFLGGGKGRCRQRNP